MADTNIDYEKITKYLPSPLRSYVGNSNRINKENFSEFITMFSGVELLAILNNVIAAEYASGYVTYNQAYLRSGVPPRLLDIVISKTIGKVAYQTTGDNETSFDSRFDSFYFSNVLRQAFTEAAMTGASAMVVYGDIDKQDAYIDTFNLFRHKISYTKNGKIKEAHLFVKKFNTDKMGSEYTIEEHRFYKREKQEDGTYLNVPYQQFLLNKCMYQREDKQDATSITLVDVPKEIAEETNISFNTPRKLEGFTDLGVYVIKYSQVNKKFPDLKIPEAMFVDAVDLSLILETSITDREIEKENGRGQILIPEFGGGGINDYQAQSVVGGRMMRTLGRHYKNPMIQQYPSRSMEDSKPSNIQFDIRTEQWENAINGDIARLCAIVGVGVIDFYPTMLGGQEKTDDEINSMTDITASTVATFRNNNTYAVNQCLNLIGHLLGFETPIEIVWDESSILNPTRNTDLVIKQMQAGLISRKVAIRRANPSMSNREIDEMISDIENDKTSVAVPLQFDNF